MSEKLTGLALLRAPFPANQISKLPKPTKQQTEILRNDSRVGIRCNLCGGWHHRDVIHLDYVGHAALTDRLLDSDPSWNWEPFSIDSNGLPMIKNGELWIKLTVCGITRPGVGDAGDKTGPNATKEMIGDAIRNAAMRFGAALDLWHKGDLHVDEIDNGDKSTNKPIESDTLEEFRQALSNAPDLKGLVTVWSTIPKNHKGKLTELKEKMKASFAQYPDEDVLNYPSNEAA